MNSHCLAFDLGAESGRAILGTVHSGILVIREVCRFPNEPVQAGHSLRWDILRLWLEMKRAMEALEVRELNSIGVDTWGVDYALIGERGELLENPFHYRDRRTDGIMEEVFRQVSRDAIYDCTGIQFMPLNTLYQFYAASRSTPRLLDAARALVTIPDLLNYWLTGNLVSEYTIASTTQFLDAVQRTWATGLLEQLNLPARLLMPIVEPGTVVGKLQGSISKSFAGTPVVAPACHDTGSAFAAVLNTGRSAFLSSGTWSLFGAELNTPVINPKSRELNFTNEGGVCRTIRLLKNICGLWLLQSCRRSWAAAGHDLSYEELMKGAGEESAAFQSLFDPDHPAFLHPEDMPSAISQVCAGSGQPPPCTPAQFTRAILESLAFKYRAVLDSLEELSGIRFDQIRIMGGGARNRLLNQYTANAAGRPVVAGPVEATALGNIAMQMLATGMVSSLAEARALIDRSFPTERFEPVGPDIWSREFDRYQNYLC